MARVVPGKDWIKGYQFWMSESEAPDSYIIWSAIAALAGVTQRKIWTKWVYHEYYTNEYIILVGPAGIVHKSSTIDMIRRMLREVGVVTASEALTKEAFIDQMIKRSDGFISAVTALPDEFSDLIRPSGPPMLEFLTSIYSCPSSWEYTTRSRGTEEITNAFVNLFGGTTPTWISNEFDITFVDQGFAARTLFVHEMEPRFRKAKVRITEEMYRMYKMLIEDLAYIGTLSNEFTWESEQAEDWFAEWYEKGIPKEMKEADYKLKSYFGRKPTHALKLAMILQYARSDEPFLTLDNMKRAKALLAGLEESMARTFSAVGRNVYANDLERIFEDIAMYPGGITREELIEKNYSAMPMQAFNEQVEMLRQMKKIDTELDRASNTLKYIARKRK